MRKAKQRVMEWDVKKMDLTQWAGGGGDCGVWWPLRSRFLHTLNWTLFFLNGQKRQKMLSACRCVPVTSRVKIVDRKHTRTFTVAECTTPNQRVCYLLITLFTCKEEETN